VTGRAPRVARMDDDYVEAVLTLVEQVPPGRVTTYGALAEAVGVGGPRLVGRVMSTYGGSVPWWRVVRADGTPAPVHDDGSGTPLERLRGEGVPVRPSGRVDLAAALWWPGPELSAPGVGMPS
jgi:alkylated DNA nucleotide flippase Atl1